MFVTVKALEWYKDNDLDINKIDTLYSIDLQLHTHKFIPFISSPTT